MRRLALLLAVALATASCSDAEPESAAPAAFAAAGSELPEGYTEARCPGGEGSGMTAEFAVPPGYTAYDGDACDFARGYDGELYVTVGPEDSLADHKERQVDPFEDQGGDDSVSDISYADDVPVFGDRRGERLEYYCYCDGQELDYRIVQAHGVRLTWVTEHGKQAAHEPAYDAVTASMALVG